MKEITDLYETINTLYKAYFSTDNPNTRRIYKDMYFNCVGALSKIEKKDKKYYAQLLDKLNDNIEMPKTNDNNETKQNEFKIINIKSKTNNINIKNSINKFINDVLKEYNYILKDGTIYDKDNNKVSIDTFLKIMYSNIKIKLLKNNNNSSLFNKEYINSRLLSILLNKKYNYKYENKFPKKDNTIRDNTEKEELMQKGLGRF